MGIRNSAFFVKKQRLQPYVVFLGFGFLLYFSCSVAQERYQCSEWTFTSAEEKTAVLDYCKEGSLCYVVAGGPSVYDILCDCATGYTLPDCSFRKCSAI